MYVSALMIAVSLVLFLYWFRYTCLLILSAKPARDLAHQVAAANELGFLDVQQNLPDARGRRQLDSLRKQLERDYRLLSYLLRHGPDFQAASGRLEQRMLMLDFKMMKLCYLFVHPLSTSGGKRALQEMAQIVGHFANKMGERAACGG